MKSEDAMWISRDGRRLAFLKLNDTKVTSISYQKIDNSDQQPGSLKYAKVSSLEILSNRPKYSNSTDGRSDEICGGVCLIDKCRKYPSLLTSFQTKKNKKKSDQQRLR